MKSLSESLNEAFKTVQKTATLKQFLVWATGTSIVTEKSIQDLFDNGGFDSYKNEKEMVNSFIKNLNQSINFASEKTDNDVEISFTIDGKDICISFMNPYK